MRKQLRLAVAALATVALAVAAAGCGGSSNSSSNGSNGGATTSAAGGNLASSQVLDMSWGAEPPSLDPGLATDTTSANVLYNIMDPLIKLGPNLQPEPNLAESWTVKGPIVTYRLRHDGRWTNGDPVTAQDFEWSWLRTISPQLAADYAYQFYGIKGAEAYNSCDPKKQNCNALRSKVGIKALGKYTLQVTLTSPQPWFVQQSAHTSFLAVNRKAVEKWGNKWTEANHIVTDGPFKVAAWRHDAELDLVKWNGWRDAKDVTLTRINGKIISDGTTAEQSYEAGDIAVDTTGIPPADIDRWKGTPDYAQYASLGTYYYGFNVKNIPDVNQRRAMAFAVDRKSIIDNIAKAGQTPATSMTPKGMPGFDTIHTTYLPTAGEGLAKAEQLMKKVANPVKNVTLYINDAPGHKEIAVAIQSMWQKLGITTTIKQQEWAQFLQFLGPPPDKSVDVYRNGWIADFVDDINFLELFTCRSGNNDTNWCNPQYDKLVAQAKATPDDDKRYGIYKQLENILTGPNGDMPIMPIYWYTFVQLEKPWVNHSFSINPLDQFDLTKVKLLKH
ncbi:MAG TPA: peptide ABC transporter substrate-binding protein [Gaiellaceae bacterium]|nr:peptide ABC transporter substrate-binding protein [Gaiellaceae bacterium]